MSIKWQTYGGDQRQLNDDVIQNSNQIFESMLKPSTGANGVSKYRTKICNPVLGTRRLFKNNHCMESYLSQVKK